MSKKNLINLHVNIVVECSDDYAARVFQNPVHEAMMKSWRNNTRTVLNAKAYSMSEETLREIANKLPTTVTSSDDLTVTIPKWVFESMRIAATNHLEDVEEGLKSGMYDDPSNHKEIAYLKATTNFDPAVFNASDYPKDSIIETWNHAYARDWMDNIARRAGWEGRPPLSLDEFLIEYSELLTEHDKTEGSTILELFQNQPV